MSVAFSVSIPEDALRRPVENVRRRFAPGAILPLVGRAGVNAVRTHLFQLDNERPNKLGGRRTHFYAQAARGTNYRVDGQGVVVSISQVGIRQRLLGGTITPKNALYLTIPARAEAYGRRAREFSDLHIVFGRGGQPVALAQNVQTRTRTNRKTGKVTNGPTTGGAIYYWLLKSVTQDPDPTVLPEPQEIATAVESALRIYFRP